MTWTIESRMAARVSLWPAHWHRELTVIAQVISAQPDPWLASIEEAPAWGIDIALAMSGLAKTNTLLDAFCRDGGVATMRAWYGTEALDVPLLTSARVWPPTRWAFDATLSLQANHGYQAATVNARGDGLNIWRVLVEAEWRRDSSTKLLREAWDIRTPTSGAASLMAG